MIYIKVHPTEEGEIIAMCDSELLGKVYTEGKQELDLSTYSGFYKGELVSEEAAAATPALGIFYTANIVGKRSVEILIKKGLAKKSDLKKVRGVPYLHLFRFF